jgi:hypothetical protein
MKSVVSCFLMLFFAIGVKRARAQKYNRAQKIVLASATFDPLGRLMVLPDGMLPTKEITDAFREKVSSLYRHDILSNQNLTNY